MRKTYYIEGVGMVLIIGEKINSTLSEIAKAIEAKDKDYIQELAKSQVDAGATMLDVNAGTREEAEASDMEWLVRTVQEVVDVPLCIDSPDPDVIETALKVHRGKALVNSVTAEKERLDNILPLVKKYECSVIGLAHGKEGIPTDVEGRVNAAKSLVEVAIQDYGIAVDDIYIDALVLPLSVDYKQGLVCLDTIRMIKESIPNIKTIIAISNISYGLPNRSPINRLFMSLAMHSGLDAAIINPLDEKLMTEIRLAKVLLGKDEDCIGYLRAHRKGLLSF